MKQKCVNSYPQVPPTSQKFWFREPEQFDRLEFAPAEEAQVDDGGGALTLDPSSKRWHRPRLFGMTLRYSRRSFRRVVCKSSQQIWCELHEPAFRYFGGATQTVVLQDDSDPRSEQKQAPALVERAQAAMFFIAFCAANRRRLLSERVQGGQVSLCCSWWRRRRHSPTAHRHWPKMRRQSESRGLS